jgi:hypothetical protein
MTIAFIVILVSTSRRDRPGMLGEVHPQASQGHPTFPIAVEWNRTRNSSSSALSASLNIAPDQLLAPGDAELSSRPG